VRLLLMVVTDTVPTICGVSVVVPSLGLMAPRVRMGLAVEGIKHLPIMTLLMAVVRVAHLLLPVVRLLLMVVVAEGGTVSVVAHLLLISSVPVVRLLLMVVVAEEGTKVAMPNIILLMVVMRVVDLLLNAAVLMSFRAAVDTGAAAVVGMVRAVDFLLLIFPIASLLMGFRSAVVSGATVVVRAVVLGFIVMLLRTSFLTGGPQMVAHSIETSHLDQLRMTQATEWRKCAIMLVIVFSVARVPTLPVSTLTKKIFLVVAMAHARIVGALVLVGARVSTFAIALVTSPAHGLTAPTTIVTDAQASKALLVFRMVCAD